MCILTIDIGNSKTKLGCYSDNGEVKLVGSSPTMGVSAGIRAELEEVKRNYPIQGVMISSVVPRTRDIIVEALEDSSLDKIEVSSELNLGLELAYHNPRQLGPDRISTAVGAYSFYGKVQNSDVIVVDFGTAITVDLVRGDEMTGGAIVPGVSMIHHALHQHTKLLPRVEFAFTDDIIGQDSETCISLGTQAAVLGGVAFLIERYSSLLESDPLIILTGGYAGIAQEKLKNTAIVDEHLLFKGLGKIWEFNKDRQ
ncbi:type III pantothenate kinase [bacterium]|nr:type III pantothenate kinase [bacterium]